LHYSSLLVLLLLLLLLRILLLQLVVVMLHPHLDAAERLCRMLLRLAPWYRRCRGSGYAHRMLSALAIDCPLQSHRRSRTWLLVFDRLANLHACFAQS
jgi:hypothetical protein